INLVSPLLNARCKSSTTRETWFIRKQLCCVLLMTKAIVDFIYCNIIVVPLYRRCPPLPFLDQIFNRVFIILIVIRVEGAIAVILVPKVISNIFQYINLISAVI
uniref:Uncharacterized protein n=1 Tax=Romanomermis culicivorax TaxID=13658 RepID=A0A915KDN7_ROMCU